MPYLIELELKKLPKNFGKKCSFKTHHSENEDAIYECWFPKGERPLYFCQWHLDDMLSKTGAFFMKEKT